jgi:hypothetical protein
MVARLVVERGRVVEVEAAGQISGWVAVTDTVLPP